MDTCSLGYTRSRWTHLERQGQEQEQEERRADVQAVELWEGGINLRQHKTRQDQTWCNRPDLSRSQSVPPL